MNIKAEQSSFSVARNALVGLPGHKITKLPSSGSHLSRYLITNQHGLELGFVEKFRDDRWTINPWKAFRGIGACCQLVGFFYAADGGYNAAVNAVINS